MLFRNLCLALALEDSQPKAKVFCLLSAEEVLGGATWEALVRTIAHVPQNLTLIIEYAEMPFDSHESNQSNSGTFTFVPRVADSREQMV